MNPAAVGVADRSLGKLYWGGGGEITRGEGWGGGGVSS